MSASSVSHFDERSGIIPVETDFGSWTQTRGDVQVDIDVPEGTSAKDLIVKIACKSIECRLKLSDRTLVQGSLFATIDANESTWTLEDRRHLRLMLVKASQDAPLWEWLVDRKYAPDAWTYKEMRDKIELEKMQMEHPGFNFSDAELKKPLDDIPEHILRGSSNAGEGSN